jgi:hypothetical protein
MFQIGNAQGRKTKIGFFSQQKPREFHNGDRMVTAKDKNLNAGRKKRLILRRFEIDGKEDIMAEIRHAAGQRGENPFRSTTRQGMRIEKQFSRRHFPHPLDASASPKHRHIGSLERDLRSSIMLKQDGVECKFSMGT